MPAPRKVDLLPSELRGWLQDELIACGFGDYEGIAQRLAERLEEGGLELRIGKSAIHAYGQDFKGYAEAQRQAQDEIRAFLEEASLKDETDVTRALFQQLTTLQWRLQMALAAPDADVSPRAMKDLTQALNNLIRSTSLRDAILKDERARIGERIDRAESAGDLDVAAAQKAREIMGFT